MVDAVCIELVFGTLPAIFRPRCDGALVLECPAGRAPADSIAIAVCAADGGGGQKTETHRAEPESGLTLRRV
jgi:hypothetical protein